MNTRNDEYVSWLNGMSVARGTLDEVERAARMIVATQRWRDWGTKDGGTTVRITRGPRQELVRHFLLHDDQGTIIEVELPRWQSCAEVKG